MTMLWAFYFWSLLAPRLISRMSVFTNETSVSQSRAVQKFSEHSVLVWTINFTSAAVYIFVCGADCSLPLELIRASSIKSYVVSC